MSVKNMIGLEAEVLVRDEKGEIIIATSYPHDDYPILGEIRGEPASSVGETLANFGKAYYSFLGYLREKHTLDMSGSATISPALHRKAVLAGGGSKALPKCNNIYQTDINDVSDQVVQPITNKIMGMRISCGLHIHFSSLDTASTTTDEYEYKPVHLPLYVADSRVYMSLFEREHKDNDKKVEKVSVSRITQPVIDTFVRELDEHLFKKYKPQDPTRYRRPGFYELKKYQGSSYFNGFEYRSLPFDPHTFKDMVEIVRFSFDLFKLLELK